MKNILITTSLCLSLSLNLFAQERINLIQDDNPFKNLREGSSDLISTNKKEEIINLYRGSPDLIVLKKIISDKNINRCASKVVSSMQKELGLVSKNEIEQAVLALRLDESLDDISAGILIKAADTDYLVHPIAKNELTPEEEAAALVIYKNRVADLQNRNLCKEDVYRDLVGKLTTGSVKFSKHIKHLNRLALNKNIIKEADFKWIETMRATKVHEWPLTLSGYRSSLDTIAKAFPLRAREASKLVTETARFRSKSSLRQNLYEKFNGTQILMLANVVRSLKKRLDSKDITIHINYVDQDSEIINLSPMEKFRFILKLLRKELATLNNGSILGGQRANYIDIITAAYEVGYISATEIEQFAALEDIWNPKKSTKEKVMVWVKVFGGVASVLLPPPFGFLSVMAIMLIDQQVQEAPINRDSDFNLL